MPHPARKTIMAGASINFIVALNRYIKDFPEANAFLKDLIFEHVAQFPKHASSRALTHVAATYRKKRDPWITPPLKNSTCLT